MGKASKMRKLLHVQLAGAAKNFAKPARSTDFVSANLPPTSSSEHPPPKIISIIPPAQPENGRLSKKDAIEEIYAACMWLTRAQPAGEQIISTDRRESAIAMRVAELQERLGKTKR